MRAAGLVLLLAAPAAGWADMTPEEAAMLPRILSAVSVDVSDDYIGSERAILFRGANRDDLTADLSILAGEPDERAGTEILTVRNVAYAGTLAGQVPGLEVSDRGSLLIRSEQTGIGRNPWEITLAVTGRDGAIVVAGFTLAMRDRITGASGRCDWNLLSGRWLSEVEIPSGPPRKSEGSRVGAVTLAEWVGSPEHAPEFCALDLGG